MPTNHSNPRRPLGIASGAEPPRNRNPLRTPENEAKLRALYPSAPWPQIEAALPGLSRQQIRNWARSLLLVRSGTSSQPHDARDIRVAQPIRTYGSGIYDPAADNAPLRPGADDHRKYKSRGF